jgi:CheY-like chemotaxis protein
MVAVARRDHRVALCPGKCARSWYAWRVHHHNKDECDQLRRVLVRQLSELGYTVEEATDGAGAIEALRSAERYDLLITDVIMPGGVNGWELARAALDLRPELRVLFTSGFPAVALSEQGLPEGVLLLGKPYRKKDLAEKVRAALAA